MHDILDCFPQIILPKKKEYFKFEEYFYILDEQNSLLLCKFRTTNRKLTIEKGRWSNIPRENRLIFPIDE
jgi:hypothetical protein